MPITTTLRCTRRLALAGALAVTALTGALAGPAAPAMAAGCADADLAVKYRPATGGEFPDPGVDNRPRVRAAMVCLINQERALRGLAAFVTHSTLTTGAQKVATTGEDGVMSFDGLQTRKANYCGSAACAFHEVGIVRETSTPTARYAVQQLMANTQIRPLLLSTSLRHIGAGAQPATWGTGTVDFNGGTSTYQQHSGGAFALELGRRY